MKLVFLEPLGIPQEKLEAMAREKLGERAEVVFFSTRVEDAKTLIERSRDADIVVLSNFRYRDDVMSHCPNLKMICVAFTGVDHVDMAYCRTHDITVCNCAGYSTVAVADLVFGLVIALQRRLIACDKVVREGGTKNGLVGFELEGKKFGVVGTGAIGLRVAKIAQAFGCEVLAYSRTQKDVEGVTYTDLDTLLSSCDIVSLHVPQNAETVGLIGKEQLALMKKSAILINTARGPVVDSVALSQALKDGIIAGAGVDVFETEPPIAKEHPLFEAPNLIASPHVAFATAESMQKRAVIVMENLDAYLNGRPQNVVK
ncbi:MAG: D-isomer specific 2-hydroxyacid dehydrogenase, NAD-binding protein [Oscillospiraceae bacterium]|nr:D-isomer specific 2-hydroxyacid dehydrogenase, NAD-binding protein [Oscillospiraceae bacterium]